MHVHVERDDKIAKYWLGPVRLQSSRGFAAMEISRIAKIIKQHEQEIEEEWNAYFGK